jgi:dolichol-phosphate mannosyltransferase
MSRIWIIIPAFNEEDGLPQVVEAVHQSLAPLKRPVHFVVVNDGSVDRTQEVAERLAETYPVTILRHPVNLNIGAVWRDGLTEAARRAAPGDLIFTCEGDNTCDMAILREMVRRLDAGDDVVMGSRYQRGGRIDGFPFMRRVYSWVINWMLRLMYPLRGATDYSIFVRGYRAEILQKALAHYGADLIESVGFVANAEVLVKLRKFHPRASSVSMYYCYQQKGGGSKLNVKKTITEYFRFFLRNCRTAKKYHDKPTS